MLQQRLPNPIFFFKLLTSLILTPILLYILLHNPSYIPQLSSLTAIVTTGILISNYTSTPMVPMLLSGILLRNLTPIQPIPHPWTSLLWSTALSSVISRAGLNLSFKMVFQTLGYSIPLGVVPVMVEMVMTSGIVRVLFGVPMSWAVVIGFGIATISPGVVVPLILRLGDLGQTRLSGLLTTALGVDVLVGTVGFGIGIVGCLGHGSHGDESWVVRMVEEVGIGVTLGSLLGLLGVFASRVKMVKAYVGMGLFVVSTAVMVWFKTMGYIGSATALMFITWAIVGNYWSKELIEKSNEQLKGLWNVFQPFLFPVIGATVSFYDTPISIFLKAFVVVFVAICVKFIASYAVTRLSGMDKDECFLVSGMWTGKASIQATLSCVALELVHRYKLEDQKENEYAQIVFVSLVTSICLGAPAAATWVDKFGKGKSALPISLLADEKNDTTIALVDDHE